MLSAFLHFNKKFSFFLHMSIFFCNFARKIVWKNGATTIFTIKIIDL